MYETLLTIIHDVSKYRIKLVSAQLISGINNKATLADMQLEITWHRFFFFVLVAFLSLVSIALSPVVYFDCQFSVNNISLFNLSRDGGKSVSKTP